MPGCPDPTSSGPSPFPHPGLSLKTGRVRSWPDTLEAWCLCARTRGCPRLFPVSPPVRCVISPRAASSPRKRRCLIFRRFSGILAFFPSSFPFAPIPGDGRSPIWWGMWPKPGRTVPGAGLWGEWGWSALLKPTSGGRTACASSRWTPGESCGRGIPCRPALPEPHRPCAFRWISVCRRCRTAFSGVAGERR